MITVAAVLALAVVGTGARLPIAPMSVRRAAASRRSSRPTPARPRSCRRRPTPSLQVPDRMAAGDGTEKIVSREEAPVDVNAKSGPRVVFPPLNQNGNPPPVASVAPRQPAAGNRRQRHAAEQRAAQDQDALPSGATRPTNGRRTPPAAAAPAPAAAPRRSRRAGDRRATAAPMPSANAPLSLSPQGASAAPQPPNPQPAMAATAPASRARAPAAAAAAIWFRSPRSGTRPTRRPRSGPCRASSRRCWDRARR